MDQTTLFPVILAGGSGSRLWPQSRKFYPKQFLRLFSEYSLLQETILRLDGLDFEKGVVVCNEEHRFLVAEQLQEIGASQFEILLEPVSRNTAPAIASAAFYLKKEYESATMLILPADHLIEDKGLFHQSISKAICLASRKNLVTFGITPSSSETGYGYIKQGGEINQFGFNIDKFVEKPSLEKAEAFVQSKNYYWNSGMFVFDADEYLSVLNQHEPKMYEYSKKAVEKASIDLDFVRLDSDSFEKCPDNSVDYAVMEKTTEAAVVEFQASWSDIGSWGQILKASQCDQNGNSVSDNVVLENAKNNLIRTKKLVCAIGINNLAVIEEDDAILVVSLDESQKVKDVVKKLQKSHLPQTLHHRKVYRPWGNYDSIDMGERFQVKRLTVKPGEKLSTQKHHHRSEHWVVVKGTALVRNGEKSMMVSENESTYIPIGSIHSLENPGKIPLEIIEIQTGAYLGEDDIVRFEDRYGRVETSTL